jgi:hypothetical protein
VPVKVAPSQTLTVTAQQTTNSRTVMQMGASSRPTEPVGALHDHRRSTGCHPCGLPGHVIRVRQADQGQLVSHRIGSPVAVLHSFLMSCQ